MIANTVNERTLDLCRFMSIFLKGGVFPCNNFRKLIISIFSYQNIVGTCTALHYFINTTIKGVPLRLLVLFVQRKFFNITLDHPVGHMRMLSVCFALNISKKIHYILCRSKNFNQVFKNNTITSFTSVQSCLLNVLHYQGLSSSFL